MPFNPTLPANNAPIVSAELRNQFNGLKTLIDALVAQVAGLTATQVPIGGIIPWCKDLPVAPGLSPNFVECNGQILSDPNSPFDNTTLPDLNNAQRFLRGATVSGGTGGAEEHTHAVDNTAAALVIQQGGDLGVNAASSLPSYYAVVWVMRVK
jgi:hypothetical protein